MKALKITCTYIFRILAVIAFIAVIGSVGAYEAAIISGTQAIIQGTIFIAVSFLLALGAEFFDDRRTE